MCPAPARGCLPTPSRVSGAVAPPPGSGPEYPAGTGPPSPTACGYGYLKAFFSIWALPVWQKAVMCWLCTCSGSGRDGVWLHLLLSRTIASSAARLVAGPAVWVGRGMAPPAGATGALSVSQLSRGSHQKSRCDDVRCDPDES